ncbi:MAG: RHS repeat-associated core domain-containing protein [Acidobacteriota bacterium]
MDAESSSRAEEGAPAIANPVAYYYVWDQVGSVRVVANAAGVIVESHDYEPYGQEIGSPPCPSASLIHYAGQERDYPTSDCSDTVDSMHFRSYGALIGRFYKPDNVMGNVYDPQSWNLYSYVEGRPVGFSDPTGHGAGPGMQPWIGNGLAGSTLMTLLEAGANQSLWADNLTPELANIGQWVPGGTGTWNLAVSNGAGGTDTYKPVYEDSFSQNQSTGEYTLTSTLVRFEPVSGGGYAIPPPFGMDAIGDWMKGKGYLDFNLTAAYGVGGTAGVQFNGQGAHLYGGWAAGFGVGGALTYSPQSITPGWGHGCQLTAIVSWQSGQSSNGSNFFEFGGGLPAGVAYSQYYVEEEPLPIHWGGYSYPTSQQPIPPWAPANW